MYPILFTLNNDQESTFIHFGLDSSCNMDEKAYYDLIVFCFDMDFKADFTKSRRLILDSNLQKH